MDIRHRIRPAAVTARRALMPSTVILTASALLLPLAATAAAAAPASAAASPAASSASAAAPAPGSVPPDQDPFYKAPGDIASYAPGKVVATRPVTAQGVKNVRAWQISYRTNDSHNAAELAVTTLLVPARAWSGHGRRPAVSVQYPEDSTGTQCAPSYALVSPGTGPAVASLFAQPLLDKGWAVAMPDFEGPRSVFMAGHQAGHAVLDGIRAVRNARLGGVTAANRWALNGYSGGAEATGWAAQLQPTYARELHLVGAAMGGTPADPAAVARFLDGGPFSGFEAAATASFATEYPEAGIEKLATPAGKALLAEARGKCVGDLIAKFGFKRLADYSTVPDPLTEPSVARVLKANTLGGAAPRTPIFDYHANTDEVVPVVQDNVMVRAWCRRGATVHKVRDLIGEHGTELVARQKDTLAFLADRFAGRRPTSTC